MRTDVRSSLSPRHAFPFSKLPAIYYPNTHGDPLGHAGAAYGAMLDSVYEMADDIATGNGWTPERAIDSACTAEGWRILPTHRRMIAARLKEL